MHSIVLRTSGLPLPGRKRPPDSDHAITILDHTRRGYSINARADDGLFSVSYAWLDGRVFSNQPDGTDCVLREFVNYGTENAALYDELPPDWVAELTKLVARIAPANYHISRNMNMNGDTDHD